MHSSSQAHGQVHHNNKNKIMDSRLNNNDVKKNNSHMMIKSSFGKGDGGSSSPSSSPKESSERERTNGYNKKSPTKKRISGVKIGNRKHSLLQDEVALEMQWNKEKLEQDLRKGMTELLELHNSEELRALCIALELEGARSKLENVELILALIDQGNVELACRKILKQVWDGIIVEYLRGLGKNLMKVRDNLRGAVMKHWARNTVELAKEIEKDSNSLLPVYMRKTVWKRTNPTSEKDLKINEFLETLYNAEQDLKECERKVRVDVDYQNVILFLSKIHSIRVLEGNFRSEILAIIQELLGERDIVLQNQKKATEHAKQSHKTLEYMIKQEKAKNYFRGFDDCYKQERLLENIRTQVELCHRERDIINLLW